jgi:excinuclease UvrABC nuclease subunit
MKKPEQLLPYIPAMDVLFDELFMEFQQQDLNTRENVPDFPGVYVFYDQGKPIYVGRAGNIRNRIQGHTRPGSGSATATFAFNLAKMELIEKITESKLGRNELVNEQWFKEIFLKYKNELSASKIRCIKIENDIIQTMFEPYLALKLGTYPDNNNFDNH